MKKTIKTDEETRKHMKTLGRKLGRDLNNEMFLSSLNKKTDENY
jgi:hypothetical protein